ncbi:type IV pilus assembly protein PilM [Granulicella pectinivorans]|uniref:Type IV pilus assembly protein PilM n=2 Tax=Granulicella pectinivorans TaxID=474950 RepID=A0A1I6MZY1_9BACT|nr:type IV pilus assembly protein PilM [Granulicella pectinivorans]
MGVMVALSRVGLSEGAFRPGLRAGTAVDRRAVVEAVRQSLEKVMEKGRETTLVVPDASVRVLLLDFDSLPAKQAEALPVVRFRLRKLLPFDSDEAAVSYQIMSTARGMVRVMAVAMPSDVLAEYEGIVRDAGFEPGAVLPSTLAVLAGLAESETSALVVNAGPEAVTTAIVRGGILMLHRSVDMRTDIHVEVKPEFVPAVLSEIPSELLANPMSLPLVDVEASAAEWAMQEPLPEHPGASDAALESVDEVVPVNLPPAEIVQAVSVAAAYFEDTLESAPTGIMVAGVTSCQALTALLGHTSLAGLRVSEMVEAAMMPASTAAVPRGWVAGVRGALRS